MNYQSMHSMVWTTANTNTFSLFPSMQNQKPSRDETIMNVNVVNATSSDEEEIEDADEDMVVDLSSGSLEPVSLQGWKLLSDITQKMRKL